MGRKFIRKYKRRFNAWIRKRPAVLLIAFGVLIGVSVFIMNQDKHLSVKPASYRPLLGLIADAESKGNYNAYFGNAHNRKINFTKMSISEVMQWQKDYVAQGSPSSAVGRYQIIDSTLAGLVEEFEIDTSQKFDKATQDKMAIALLERRGSIAYVNNQLNSQEFASNLAKEWASLPKVTGKNPDASYYAGDGLNKSLVDRHEVLGAIESIQPDN